MRFTENETLTMECPHCKRRLTLKEAITILHGSGFEKIATVALPNGTVAFVEAGLVNPREVEILEEG
jgi:hypothetical protein